MSQPIGEPVPGPSSQERPLIGRHPVDAVSLVPGLLAVAVAAVALLDLDLDVDAGLLLALLLLLAGLAGLVASVRSRG